MYIMLSTKDGDVPFVINGEVCDYCGTVSIVSADNPASTSLGGFKELYRDRRRY